MKRSTAIGRLRTIAESCARANLPADDDEPLLEAAYAYGEVLEPVAELSSVKVAFVLNHPADELTWGSEPQWCVGLIDLLRLDKAPVDWCWRPSVWPVWNHRIKRPVRLWSLDGPNEDALDALASGDVDRLRLPAPTHEDEVEQIEMELQASLTHLRRVKESFWEPRWRKEHKGFGGYPEAHLWNAVYGYLDLLDASRSLKA